MSIHRKIASFAANTLLMEAGWISWLVVGFSTGGVGVLLSRTITLIRRSTRLRRLRARMGSYGAAQAPSALLLSSGW
jgi:hypothetical protein